MDSVQVKTRSQKLNCKVSVLLLSLLMLVNLFSIGCTSSEPSKKGEQRIAEASPVPSTPLTVTATPTQPINEGSVELPPPKPEEVREAIARVYKDAVTIDTRHLPTYIVGDFNGDGSEDIAVVVRPARDKVEEINDEVANWIVEDPRLVVLPDPHKSVQPLPPSSRPIIKPNDLLLTIIHGYKQEGWRNKEAQQTYLLDNAVGNSMTPLPLENLEGAHGNQNRTGDVIKETLAGEQGFLYWTGAKYAWRKTVVSGQ